MSNLKQCATAIILYCDEGDGIQDPPPYTEAKDVLATAPTCDLYDYWNPGCRQDQGEPIIGSYGYVPDILAMAISQDPNIAFPWRDYAATDPEAALFVSPFYGDQRTCKFMTKVNPTSAEFAAWLQGCKAAGMDTRIPSQLLRVRVDTSVEVRHFTRGRWLAASWINALD